MARVPKRIASTVINSLKGGVVPRVGLPYVTVGREHEIEALVSTVRARVSCSRPSATMRWTWVSS